MCAEKTKNINNNINLYGYEIKVTTYASNFLLYANWVVLCINFTLGLFLTNGDCWTVTCSESFVFLGGPMLFLCKLVRRCGTLQTLSRTCVNCSHKMRVRMVRGTATLSVAVER